MGARSTKILSVFALAYSLLIMPVAAFASEWVEGYTNTRAVGMGGALIGVTSDETSLFRNPANLGSIRGYFGSLIDPELEGQGSFTDIVRADALTKAVEVETMAAELQKNPGEFYHAKAQFTPSFTTKNFGFGVLYRNELNAVVSTTATTSMDTFYQNDLGVVLGFNQSLFGGVIKVGASAKALNRIEVVSGTLSTGGPFDLGTIAAEGSAIAYDAGLMIQVPVAWVPTLAVVAHDIGDTEFTLRDGVRARTASQPATVKQSVDAAISLFPIHGNKIRSTWTVEYRDVTNSREEEGSKKRLHIGAEVNFKDLFFLRAGMNQGYYTGGIEISSERFAWQISSYGEEIGTADAPKEDRRYSTRILIRY
ncbi:hypothetical protein [Pseudobdellovibrio sp. HCB154]|uniref:hypothetical protein n=1 Tax=Pseudobdellovibrio sp. HCB154 TaxID=3386277 RepID=UPI0039172F35